LNLSVTEHRSTALTVPLTAAVIGTGKISEQHLSYLSGAAEVRPVAVCDLSPAVARYAADRFGVPHAFQDYCQMLRDLQPQVVHILTPPHTHGRIVMDVIESGAHAIVEKPLAPSHDEFHRLWSASRERGVWLIENHNYRFNRPILQLERWVAGGHLGSVREVEVRMSLNIRDRSSRYADENLPHPSHRLPAGVIHEFVTHLCYLLQRFMPRWQSVKAAWRNLGGGELFKFDDLDAVVESGDTHGRLRFTAAGWPESFTVDVRGTMASAHADLFWPVTILTRPRGGPAALTPLLNQYARGAALKRAAWRNFFDKLVQKTPYEGLPQFLRLTYAALQREEPPPVTFDDMDRAAGLIDALLDEKNRI
jgi:predicted dehydrogenase